MNDVVGELYRIGTAEELVRWRDHHVISPDLILNLIAEARRLREKRALDSALLLSEWSVLLADCLSDPVSKGRAIVSRAVTRVRMGDNAVALSDLNEALDLFEKAGNALWAANVRVNRVIAYSHFSRYEDALRDAQMAEAVLERHEEKRSLACNCANAAKVLCQLDRFQEAMGTLRKAERLLLDIGDRNALAHVYMNHAVALASLNRLSEALEYYRLCAGIAAETGDRALGATCQYNLGYVHYLRGEYTSALELLQNVRGILTADRRERAFCDLTQSEICLELNMDPDAMRFAEAAYRAFERLAQPFEMAKARAVMGMAASRLREFADAARWFDQARKMFERQGNPVRAATVDLYQAMTRFELGQYDEARRLAGAASAAFLREDVKPKAALARIVSMRASLQLSDVETASRDAAEAVVLHGASPAPQVGHLLHSAIGELYMAQKRFDDARREFKESITASERLRSNIGNDELRMNFLKDKLPAYERLMKASLRGGPARHREAFETVERAKSRTMVDRLINRIDAPDNSGWSPVEEIQKVVPAGAALIEYFANDDDIGVFYVTSEEFEVVERVSSRSAARQHFEFLQYQMARARVHAGRVRDTENHLHDLYRLLAGPIEGQLRDRTSLVVVPCDFLYGLPWHALFDGERHLMDRFPISYAPSANIYRLCGHERFPAEDAPLIVGVGGRRMPHIASEVEAIRSVLPNAKTLLGSEATVDRVIETMTGASLIHIAAHAAFCPDRAMFSSMELHDGHLNVFDLDVLHTSARLVTLSGCGTGLNRIVRGDELLGLFRGFLCAGATSVLMSLWDVHDRTTSDLMKSFYRHLASGKSGTESLRLAMAHVREEHPHPYYWAPFVLMGNPARLFLLRR